MNSRQAHGPECTFSECILGEDEIVVDLNTAISKNEAFALNEKKIGSCKTIFKPKEEMLDRNNFCESNDDDIDLLIYIPFTTQVKIRSMRMIGGEDGTSPRKIKLFVNKNNPGFEMSEEKATQEIDCVENPDGRLPYYLSTTKFNSVWSITLIVTMNYLASNTKIYYIGFEGISTHKRRTFKLEISEAKPQGVKIERIKEDHSNDHLIYG